MYDILNLLDDSLSVRVVAMAAVLLLVDISFAASLGYGQCRLLFLAGWTYASVEVLLRSTERRLRNNVLIRAFILGRPHARRGYDVAGSSTLHFSRWHLLFQRLSHGVDMQTYTAGIFWLAGLALESLAYNSRIGVAVQTLC
jgi:hypothetical protein